MKIPKCPKSVTGKHKFSDTSYEVFWNIGTKVHSEKVKRPIVCDYCGLIDDRSKGKV